MQDHARSDLSRDLVVGAIAGDGANGVLRLLLTRPKGEVVLDALAIAAVLVLLATATGTRGVA
jgi:hypothetical protein